LIRLSSASLVMVRVPIAGLASGSGSGIRTMPYTPKTNGKAERFIQTSLRE